MLYMHTHIPPSTKIRRVIIIVLVQICMVHGVADSKNSVSETSPIKCHPSVLSPKKQHKKRVRKLLVKLREAVSSRGTI